MVGLGLRAEHKVFAMQASQKPAQEEPAAKPAAPVAGPSLDVPGGAHASPARALQARLVREMTRARKPWLWHTTGLVLTALLSFWAAGQMLSASL